MDTKGYQVNILALSEEDGGGYVAVVPDLPGCMADGETPAEALEAVQESIALWIEVQSEDGEEIPEPKNYKTNPEYSGRIGLRIPRWMHARVAQAAQIEGCSMNQFIQDSVSYALGMLDGKNSKTSNAAVVSIERRRQPLNWGQYIDVQSIEKRGFYHVKNPLC